MSLSEEEGGEDFGGGWGCWELPGSAQPQSHGVGVPILGQCFCPAPALPNVGFCLHRGPASWSIGRLQPLKINLLLKKKRCIFEVKRVMIFHLADSNSLKGGQNRQEAREHTSFARHPARRCRMPFLDPAPFRSGLISRKQPHQNISPTCRLPACENPTVKLRPGRRMKSAVRLPGWKWGCKGEGSLQPPKKESRHFLGLVLGWESGESPLSRCVGGARVKCSV